MMNKEDIKDRNRLELALDHEMRQLISFIAYNWDMAASRMEQITKDREQGLYDDDGTEAIAVFARLERVLSALFAVNGRPQAVLLKDLRELLNQMANDKRMDCEIACMMTAEASELSIQVPTIWKRLGEMLASSGETDDESKAVVRELYQKNYIPNMEGDDALEVMQSLVNDQEPDELKKKELAQAIDGLVFFGENIGKLASVSKRQMAIGMACVQLAVRLALAVNDLQQEEDADVDLFFQAAKKDLLSSEDWQEYWRSHIGHLSQKGSVKAELRKDAEEVKQELLDFNRYLYTKMEESPESFGRALKEADLSNDDMLRLLWLAAKREAIERERGPVDPERGQMERGVTEASQKLKEQAADKYYDLYDEIWDDIMLNDIIASQLKEFSKGKHNDGFNMQVFCQIVGWLQENYRFYGDNTSVTLGKTLNDGKESDTYKKYIGTQSNILNQQTISELAAILAKERA